MAGETPAVPVRELDLNSIVLHSKKPTTASDRMIVYESDCLPKVRPA